MLEQICDHIHNHFIKEARCGEYEIAGGMISLPFLKEGQRFWITNSDLNDGMYTYHSDGITNDDDTEAVGLQDETWAGTICALAVPPAVIALSAEVKAWVDKYGDAVNSPYMSENVIGVYSYTRRAGSSGSGTTPSSAAGWQDVFRDRLNRWRKVCL
jgi:hypothetical protein